MRTFAASVLTLLAVATPALAQQGAPTTERQLVDRVVAVVGDTVLLLSDVQAELQQMQAAGQPLPEDERARAAVIEGMVENRVNDLLLLTAAKAAGIQVRDEEVAATVDQQVRAAQSQFQTEAEFRQALAASGMTLEEYRVMVGQQYRGQALTQRFLQQRLSTAPRPTVTEAEIREVYDAQREMLGDRPETVSFQQVLVEVKASEQGRADARTRALAVLEELRGGANFEVLARRHSDDPGSREQGGDLGWFRRGRMVPAFENAVWAMRPGDVSGLVETDFGFHVIRVERVRGAERQARHILIRPEVTQDDMQSAWERADSVATAAREGAAFAELIRRYPSAGENRIDRAPLDRLPPVYVDLFRDATPNQIVGPFEEQGPTGSRWVVARVTERGQAGEWTLDDVRDQIRDRVQEQQMLEQLVADLRRTTYVNVMF
jgi:peptidyl-prolyl cis-trans isomerase SurA